MQWAYKKGHFTELLPVKITDDWRRALDKNYVVGVVFVHFRKAFDAVHSILLRKRQSLSVAWDFMELDKGLFLWKNASDND